MPKDQQSSAERRDKARTALKIPVDYSAVDVFFTEFSANINEGGMFIDTDAPAEIGTLVQLHFRLPGLDEPIQVLGRVAWVSEEKEDCSTGMGIEFQDLTTEAREQINRIVRKLRFDKSGR